MRVALKWYLTDCQSKTTYMMKYRLSHILLTMLIGWPVQSVSAAEEVSPTSLAPPTNVELSSTEIAENAGEDALVGSFSAVDPEGGTTFTYTLTASQGANDNAVFQIQGNNLLAGESFNFEEKASYAIEVTVTDAQSEPTVSTFTITVTDVNEPPTDIILSNSTIVEDAEVGSVVGTLSVVDEEDAPEASLVYTLVNGEGSADNGDFDIDGNQLVTNVAFDITEEETRSVRIQVTDTGGETFAKAFTITVTDEEEPNQPPTDITLSNNTVAESAAVGTTVGALPTTDPEDGPDATFTYALVDGAGSANNDQFTIANNSNELRTAVAFDVETNETRSVRIRTTDSGGLSLEKSFEITIEATPNQPPTDITLSNSTIAEDASAGTAVGTLSTTDPEGGPDTEFTYALVDGAGSANNAQFAIDGSDLVTTAGFNAAAGTTLQVRIQTTDAGGETFAKAFTIAVTNPNAPDQPPTDITLDPDAIAENQPELTLVGRFTTTDPDNPENYTYRKVGGVGSNDNPSFRIQGDSLLSDEVFDFETKASYQVRIQAIDTTSENRFEKSFEVTIVDVDETANQPPTDIRLSQTTIAENEPEGSLVGNLSTVDLDDSAGFTYALTEGEGDSDNASFRIRDNQLLTDAAFDFETKASYQIRISTTDEGGASFSEAFTIEVTDVDEDTNQAPTDLELDSNTIAENEPFNTPIGTFTVVDPDPDDRHVVSLVEGDGDDDNGRFQIRDNVLYSLVSFDFEEKDSYSIRVQGRDPAQATVTEVFAISVTDVEDTQNQAPTAILLSNTQVGEGQIVNLVVGEFSAEDPDADDTHTFALVSGEGDDDNAIFSIADGQLQTAQVFDTDIQTRYRIRVLADDGRGGTLEESFTITVTEGEDPVTALEDESPSVWQVYPVPADRRLTIKAPTGESTLQFRLLDTRGRLIVQYRFNVNSSSEYSLALPEEISTGTYFLEISTAERVSRQRVILR